jgi:hypothetical protein
VADRESGGEVDGGKRGCLSVGKGTEGPTVVVKVGNYF